MLPKWGSTLANLYWNLRIIRNYNQALRRKYYRKIAHEKKRLEKIGVDPECVRLLCRFLANTRNPHAEQRFLFYKRQGNLF